MEKVFINNKFVDKHEAAISIFDRGFLFADGVYEVLPVYNNSVLFLEEHLLRLQKSLMGLEINYPKEQLAHDYWIDICQKLIEFNGPNRPIYIQITRGNQDKRLHSFKDYNLTPTTVAFSQDPIKLGTCLEFQSKGVSIITLPDTRWNNCHIKSISLLGNILLNHQAEAAGANEALLIRENGHIQEGCSTNYFIVKNNQVLTPNLNNHILPGITREIIIKLCKKNNITIIEKPLVKDDLYQADEIWLTSSTREIRPVTKIDDRILNQDKPGPLWFELANLYINYIKNIINL